MQLIQIGEVRQKTVLDMVREMASKQLAEIELLKRNAARRYARVERRQKSSRCSQRLPRRESTASAR
jgi:hypothetical protein